MLLVFILFLLKEREFDFFKRDEAERWFDVLFLDDLFFNFNEGDNVLGGGG